MSAEDARKFVELVDSDSQLQEAVKTNQGNLADLAAQRGFNISQEELHDELRARWGIGRLGDDSPSGQCNTTGNTEVQCNTEAPQCNTTGPQCNTEAPQCNTTSPQCNTGPDQSESPQCNTTGPPSSD